MSKLTTEEINVINKLADIWTEYNHLEESHHSDKQEFTDSIHRLQDIVVARLAVREHPELFYRTHK